MDVHRASAGITDEEWIAKYRAAIASLPIPQSRWVKLRALFEEACGIVFSSVARAVHTRRPPVLLPRPVRDARVVPAEPGLSAISQKEAGGALVR